LANQRYASILAQANHFAGKRNMFQISMVCTIASAKWEMC
jgi:hypothetical protein